MTIEDKVLIDLNADNELAEYLMKGMSLRVEKQQEEATQKPLTRASMSANILRASMSANIKKKSIFMQ
jgi:hypothetical protein